MKIALIFHFLLFGLPALAFEYHLDEGSLIRPSFYQRYQLTEHFQKFDLTTLTQQNLSAAGRRFDAIYVDSRFQKKLLLKAGLGVPENIEGQILVEPNLDLLAFHFKFDGTPYLLIALNFSKEDFQKIVSPWIKQKYSILWWLAPQPVFANENCYESPQPWSRLISVKSDIEQNSILRSVGRCGADAIARATQSANDTLDFFKNLATNPKKVWQEIKASADELTNLTLNFRVEISSLFESLTGLTEEQKVQLACSISGSILTKALTGGGVLSLGALLPKMIQQLKKVGALLKEISSIEKKGVLLPNKSFLTQEALHCAL